MQELTFNTTLKTAKVIFENGEERIFDDVPTVKVRPEGFYEIMQKDMDDDKQYPVYRTPIANTNMSIEK